MPYLAQLIDEGTGFHNKGTGVLRGQEIIEVQRGFAADRALLEPITHGFIDLMEVTAFQVSTADMKTIAGLDIESAKIIQRAWVAIAAPEDLMYGMSRMYEGLMHPPGWTIEVFRSMEEARAWVALCLAAPV